MSNNNNEVKVADRELSPQMAERFRVLAESTPRYLYKYRADDRGTDSIFCENTIYFSSPTNFNDPFDCQLNTDTNNTREEIEKYLLDIQPDLRSKSKLLKSLVDTTYNNPIELHRIINNSLAASTNKTGVSCFSEKFDNLLMWSHYAGSHKGLCLKVDLHEDKVMFDAVLKVNYHKIYPSYNHIRDGVGMVDLLLSAKSRHWKYEKEWRVIKPLHTGAHGFKKTALIEVIFGCRAEDSFINKIRTLAKGAGMDHLVYKKARVSITEFKLDFEDIP